MLVPKLNRHRNKSGLQYHDDEHVANVFWICNAHPIKSAVKSSSFKYWRAKRAKDRFLCWRSRRQNVWRLSWSVKQLRSSFFPESIVPFFPINIDSIHCQPFWVNMHVQLAAVAVFDLSPNWCVCKLWAAAIRPFLLRLKKKKKKKRSVQQCRAGCKCSCEVENGENPWAV